MTMTSFAYAKLDPFHYQTFDRKKLQFTNVPVIEKPPAPPLLEKVEDPFGGEVDVPKDEPQEEAETAASEAAPETSAGLDFLCIFGITHAKSLYLGADSGESPEAESGEPTNDSVEGDQGPATGAKTDPAPEEDNSAEAIEISEAPIENVKPDAEPTAGGVGVEEPNLEDTNERKEAEFAPIDPAAGSDSAGAEGEGIGGIVSRRCFIILKEICGLQATGSRDSSGYHNTRRDEQFIRNLSSSF